MKTIKYALIRHAASAIALIPIVGSFAGCSFQSNPIMSSGPTPRVEDCMLLQQATPARFVCNGKIYTAVQLTDIRNGTGPASAAK
jgi:hypothetical protein